MATDYTVTNTNDSGPGSLRQAMINAVDGDDVVFNIPTSDPGYNENAPGCTEWCFWEIMLLTELPAINHRVYVDGGLKVSPAGNPNIVINGANLTAATGFLITHDQAGLRNLAIVSFDVGVELSGVTLYSNRIDYSWIGVYPGDPPSAAPNGTGVRLSSAFATINGNVISGNTNYGIHVTSPNGWGNTLEGNKVGVAPNVLSALPNGVGIRVAGYENKIGIPGHQGGNIISGNTGSGLVIVGDNNEVDHNHIGVDVLGDDAIPNGEHGVVIGGTGNKLGRSDGLLGDGNVISGNAANGVLLEGTSNTIENSYIGTDATGTFAIPNGEHGVEITEYATDPQVGVSLASGPNLISGNTKSGVRVTYNPVNPIIRGNYIGLGMPISADVALANGENGIHLWYKIGSGSGATNATVGGHLGSHRNIISGNSQRGIMVEGRENTIRGNYIGTDWNGLVAIPNQWTGVWLDSPDNTVMDNLISGNGGSGVRCFTGDQIVTGNKIGTDVNGSSPLGNGGVGVDVGGAPGSNYQIGGTVFGEGNVIAFNGQAGVEVGASSTQAAVRRNSIFSNGGLGIDLYPWGKGANDSGDSDTGTNNLMNYPELLTAGYNSSTLEVLVTYLISSTSTNAPRPLHIEFFIADVAGEEGMTYIGSKDYTDPLTGFDSALFTSPIAITQNKIVATATDANGNTSEFAPAVEIDGVDGITMDIAVLLEGPFVGPGMTHRLKTYGKIPTLHPFGEAPWHYGGIEGGASPSGTTDWVLVGLRTGTSAGSLVARRAGFLMDGGSIVDLDGTSPLFFPGVESGGYYVTVEHRNHLGIMSAMLVDARSGEGSWDFTTGSSRAYGTVNAMVDLGGTGAGPWGMFAGDADADGDVDANDLDYYIDETALGIFGYQMCDFNLDTRTQALDADLSIRNAVGGRSSQVP